MIKSIAQQLTVHVLVIILLAYHINTLVIVVDFVANQDFIAKTLCIQKNNQQGCNGKCHLKNQLAKNETGGNTPTTELKRLKLDTFFVSDISTIPEEKNWHEPINHNLFYTALKIYQNSISVDTPPPNFV